MSNWLSEKYEAIGNEIIKELFPHLSNVDIAWLASDKEKKSHGKIICAECEKVPERFKWCCEYDFTITVYEPNIENFTPEQIKILLEHEIMHIGADGTKYYIVPHDVEEFKEIIQKYGLEWHQEKTVDYALLED